MANQLDDAIAGLEPGKVPVALSGKQRESGMKETGSRRPSQTYGPKILGEFPRPQHQRKPVLVAVFAHPDDETFLAGGTLAQHSARGWEVRLICATNGEHGSRGRGLAGGAGGYASLRLRELREAARRLGIGEVTLLEATDGGLDESGPERKEMITRLLKAFYRFFPDVILSFGPDGVSGHPDHVAMAGFAREAFRRYCAARSHRESDPLFYSVVPSPGIPKCCRKETKPGDLLPLTTVIDTRQSWSRKLAAMEAYVSQSHLLESLRRDPIGWSAREEWFHQPGKCFPLPPAAG